MREFSRTASATPARWRINSSVFVNPVVLYSLIWLAALALLSTRWATFMTGVSRGFLILVLGNIAISIVVYFAATWLKRALAPVHRPGGVRSTHGADSASLAALLALRRYSDLLFAIWVAGSLINVWFSGGLPIVWNLRGDDRTYADYGLPTFSGLIAACGLFASLGFFLLSLLGKRKSRWWAVALVFVYQFAILNRGGTVWMALEMLGVYLLVGRSGIRRTIVGALLVLLLITLFGVMGSIRVGKNYSHLSALATPEGEAVFEHLPSGFWWTYLYAAVGPVNLNAVIDGYVPLGRPYWSVVNLFPTVVRNLVYTETVYEARYPLKMVVGLFNVFTLYGGYLADFGLVGCFAITLVLQLLAVHHYLRASSGDLASIIAYAVCFQVIVVSLFTDSLTSWPALFQLFLAFAFRYFARESARTTLGPGRVSIDGRGRLDRGSGGARSNRRHRRSATEAAGAARESLQQCDEGRMPSKLHAAGFVRRTRLTTRTPAARPRCGVGRAGCLSRAPLQLIRCKAQV
jgi:oligosaccharide repeat unit polymerase